jgi:L-threo-3-deoxy-hexylosonate aldolase
MPQPIPRSPLPEGIWAPTQVFFHDDAATSLDLETVALHAVRLARAGVAGLVTNGSNGEAAHLTASERAQVTRTTRTALDAAGFTHVPVVAGASDQSLQGTLSLIEEARQAGAAAVLLLVPSFFRWAMDAAAMEKYFVAVADQGSLPVVIYNYPGAVAGLDLDSDMLVRLARHPNIVGTKFTCGNIGKLARVAAAVNGNAGRADYRCFSGVADAITPALSVGGHGGIVGAANVFPRACVEVYRLFVEGKLEEARVKQQRLALADWALTKRAIPGFKAILSKFHGYGGIPRLPVQSLSKREEELLFSEVEEMMKVEQQLEDFGRPRQ